MTIFFSAIAFAFFLLFAPFAYAAPSISGTSTDLAHGESVTITGTDFGTKTTAAPTIWDNCSHGDSLTTRWTGGWPTENANYNPNYRAAQRGIPMPHARTTKYLTMCNYGDGGYDAGWNGIFWKSFASGSTPSYVFFSFRMRIDDSFNSGDNWKFLDYSCGSEPYAMSSSSWSNWYTEQMGGISTGTLDINLNDDGGSLRPWINQENIWNADTESYDTGPSPKGNWIQIEGVYYLTSSTNGIIRYWINGEDVFDYSSTNPNPAFAALDHWTDRYTAGARTFGFGGYTRNYNTNNWWYFADIYFDTTWARVMLGNASTYAACTIREPQIPSSWGTTSITVEVNQGALDEEDTAYLYVVKSDGTYNSTGYAVTFGEGGGEDTTAPSVTFTTGNSSISADSLSISGTASDAVGVSGCKWRIGSQPDGSNGTSLSGTTSWSGTASGFSEGEQTLHVGCYDAAANWGYDSITVTYTPSEETLPQAVLSGARIIVD
jgi:hypothetical protein